MPLCDGCGMELIERLVTRIQPYQGREYLLEDLPALVCPQCGAIFYTPAVHDYVIDLITSGNLALFNRQAELRATYGILADDPIECPPQLPLEEREELLP